MRSYSFKIFLLTLATMSCELLKVNSAGWSQAVTEFDLGINLGTRFALKFFSMHIEIANKNILLILKSHFLFFDSYNHDFESILKQR